MVEPTDVRHVENSAGLKKRQCKMQLAEQKSHAKDAYRSFHT